MTFGSKKCWWLNISNYFIFRENKNIWRICVRAFLLFVCLHAFARACVCVCVSVSVYACAFLFDCVWLRVLVLVYACLHKTQIDVSIDAVQWSLSISLLSLFLSLCLCLFLSFSVSPLFRLSLSFSVCLSLSLGLYLSSCCHISQHHQPIRIRPYNRSLELRTLSFPPPSFPITHLPHSPPSTWT